MVKASLSEDAPSAGRGQGTDRGPGEGPGERLRPLHHSVLVLQFGHHVRGHETLLHKLHQQIILVHSTNRIPFLPAYCF